MTKKELKYVNSLKEENERVKNLLLRFVDAIGKLRNLDDVVNMSLIPLMTEENQKIRAEIKAEAIKEFAERVKPKLWCGDDRLDLCIRHNIDTLVKEMVGEEND